LNEFVEVVEEELEKEEKQQKVVLKQ